MNRKIKNNKLLFLKLICMMFTIYIYTHTYIYKRYAPNNIYLPVFISEFKIAIFLE
jgi:hypothetical protein